MVSLMNTLTELCLVNLTAYMNTELFLDDFILLVPI